MSGNTEAALRVLTAQAKKYARIDYDEDDELVEIMVDATLKSMEEVIPAFDRAGITSRQKIIMFKSVKSMYDDRDQYGRDQQAMKAAATSMLLSEIYEAKAAMNHG